MVKQLRFLLIFLLVSVGGVWGQLVSFTTNPPAVNGAVNICLGQKVIFTNTTTGISSSASYNWVFNGGNPTTGNSSGPYEVTYSNAGTFSATLTVNGTSFSMNITVGSASGPTAALTLIPGSTGTSFTSYQGMTFFTKCGNSTSGNFQFNDANQSTYPSGTTQTIVWGDGGSTSSSPLPNPVSHIYTGAGIDYMTYTITFPNGCTSTANYGVFIGNSPPGLSINAAASESCIPGDYSFSLGGQNVPGTTFQVTFNDGSPDLIYSSWAAIPSTITHTFNDVSCGVTSSVNNQSYPNSYSIQATATNACNPLGTYVGFGPIYVSEGPTPLFTTSPSSTVCVNTNLTLSNTSLAGVNALPLGCNSDKGFYWEISPNTGYSLLPNSSLGSNNGQIGTLYDWTNWTNGSNDLNVSFTQPGTYIIKLTIGNNCGPEFITDTICVMPAVTSQFSTNVLTGCAPLQINTSNLSSTATCSGYSNNFTWSISNYQNPQNCQSYAAPTFLNGTTLNSLNPVLSFTEPGIYQLQLANELTPTLSGSSCASQTSTVTINVKDVPIVSLPAPTPICITSSFNPLATVNSCYDSSLVNYSWNFGTSALPQLSNILNPSVSYNTSGTYNYSLTANNICGSDTETQQITVQPSANVSIGALGLSCEAGPVTLSGSITGGSTTGSWTAVPNIGSFSPNNSSLNATFNPPIGTTGQIQLTLTSAPPPAPCPVAIQSVVLNINGQATANAGQDIAICQGQTVSLNGAVGGSATTGSWSTSGNGTFSSATSLNSTYTPGASDILNGGVNIILTTNDPGLPCSPKTDTLHVTIKPNPTISETTLDSLVCSNEIFNISLSSNISNFPTSYAWNVVNPSALPSSITTTLSGTISPPNNTLSGVIASGQSSPSTITYQIVGTTNGCPSQPIFQQIIINPTPTPSITPSGTSSFCEGSSTTLSASNSTTYLWSNNQTTQNITVSAPGTYSVVTTNQYGCQGQSVGVVVSQINLVTPIFSAIAPICSNGTFSLPITSTNGITGTWSPAINNLATTTYTFTPSSGQCANTAQMTVTVNPLPTPTITANGPTTFCQGSAVILSTTGGGTYMWNLNGTAIANATTVSLTATQAGSYSVTVTNANGCTATSTGVTLAINPNPQPVISPISPATICTGASMIISTSSTFSNYAWYLGSSTSSLGSNDSLQITTAGSYTVSVTNSNGCTGLSTPFVLQTTAPITPTFTTISPICAGGTFTLQNTSLNGITGFWSPAPNFTTTTVYTFTPLSGSCANTTTMNIVVKPQPTVLANGVTICSGSSITLNATPSLSGGTFSWSNGPTTQSNLVSPITNTTYTVNYTLNGCIASDTAQVIVIQTPSIVMTPATICAGQSTTISPVVSPTGGVYQWNTNATTASISVSPTTNTTYSLTYSVNGCQASQSSALITVNPVPTVSTTSSSICAGQSALINATVSPTGGTYLWSTNQTTPSISVSPASTTTYNLVYTVNGCASTPTNATINVTPLPVVSAPNYTICSGQSTTLNTTVNTPGGTYVWSPNTALSSNSVANPVASPNNTQIYTVTYTVNGCTSLPDSVVVSVIQSIQASVNSPVICNGASTTLTASPANANYLWSNGATTQSITLTPTNSQALTVTVSAAGCPSSNATANVTVNPIPSVSVANVSAICNGSSATLTATPSAPNGTYLWSSGQTTNTISVSPALTSPTTAQNFNYSVVYTLNGCPSTAAAVVVAVNPVPTVSLPTTTTICNGSGDTLVATVNLTGGTYSWSNGLTTPSIIVNPVSNTNYSVSYSLNGCNATSASTTGNVVVNPIPMVSVTGPLSICAGQQATLTATPSAPGGSYLWSNGATSASINVSPTTTTTYSVVYTLNGCASAPFDKQVPVNPIPTISVTSPITICGGLSTQITPTVTPTGGTFLWSANASNATTSQITVNPTVTTTYSVIYTANGCSQSQDVQVQVIQNPQAQLTNDTICLGQSATLVASPNGANYSWNNGATTQSITVSPTVTSTYTVTVNIGGCAATSATAQVTVNPIPSVSVANVSAICNGSSTTLTATPSAPNGTYLWSNGQTSNTISVSPPLTSPTTAQNFNYSVVYTLNGCPSLADTVAVAVNPVPTVSLPTTTTICNGSGDTLVATVNLTGGTYLWSNNATTSQIIVNPTANTNYSVSYSLNGCSATSASTTGNVVVNPIPTVTIPTPASICAGQQATLTATPSAAGGSYLWSNGATSASINVNPTTTTTYSVVYTLNGCASAPTSITVTVNPIPIISVTSPITICGGLSTQITPTVTPTGGTFLWSANASNATTSQITVNPTVTTTYSVIYTANGCSQSQDVQVQVIQNPQAQLTNDTICLGQSATLVASPNGANYSWNNGATTQSITVSPTVTSTYTVTVNIGGCAATSATAQVTVNPIPSVSVANVAAICNGTAATLTATPSAPGGTYLWSNGLSGNTISFTPPLTNPTTAQNFNYSVVYTLNGCPSLADTVTVAVNPVPTVSLPTTTTICNGSGDTIVATVNLTGGTYLWSNNATTSQIIVNPTANTNYSVSYSLNGCSATSASTTGNVVVNPIPTVSVTGPVSICAGQQATLTATPSAPGGSYLWSNGATSASINVSPTTTTTYSVVYTLNGCASAPFDKQVPVNPIPTININDTTICGGLSVLLSPAVTPSGGTFLWSANASNATTSQVTVNPTVTTTYSLIYTANGCSQSQDVQVQVIQNPQAQLTNDTICLGQSTTLVASPNGANYSWSTGATTQSITVNPSVTSTYTVTVNIGGCAATSATATVVVRPIPSVSVANVSAICNGSSATLTATPSAPNGTYLWSSGQTTNTISVSPPLTSPTTAQNFNYSVVYTLNGCPSTAAAVVVTVNPVPTVSLPTTTTICNGSGDTIVATVNLTGGTYLWSNNATTSQIIVNPTANTNYSVSYSLNGCSATSASTTGNVVVNPIPTVTIPTPASICAGQQATLTATPSAAGGSYLWSNGATSASINVNPTTTTTYSVVYTLNGCASAPTSITVTVNPIPTININDTTICGGLSVLLSPAVTPSGGTFLWSANASNATTSQVTVNPTVTTTYSLIYTANGCSQSQDVQVQVIQNPQAQLTNDTICLGQSTTLVASPNGANYSWSTGATTQSITVSPTVTSTYTVTVNIGGCAATSATATVVVRPIPSVTVSNVSAICNGSSATLTATPSAPNGTYLWSSGQTTNTISVSPALTSPTTAQNFNYSVVYTLNGCPSTAAAVVVAVNPVPTVSLPTTTTICNGSGDTIVATVNLTGGTYLWSNNATTSQIIVNPTTNTNYSVSYSLNGCSATSASTTGNVVVNPIPTVSVTGPLSICAGQQATLTATPSAAGGSYLWSNGATSASINVSPTTTTTYSVVYTLNGCASAPFDKQVPVNPIPTININDTTICGGLSVLLSPAVTPSGGTFLWSANASNATTSQVTVNPTVTTTYSLIYTANGCSQSQDVQVQVIQNPQAQLTNDTICLGQSTTLVASPNGANYSWSTGATTQSITVNPSVTSTYTVTVNIGGCAATSATATVTVNPIPSVSVANVSAICNGSSTTLTATPSAPNGTYLWSNGQTSNTISVSPALTSPTTAQNFNYSVVYTLNGCPSLADTVAVAVNPVPTVSFNDTTICEGTSAILVGTPNILGGAYLWSNGANTQQINVSPSVTTNYTLIYNLNGCGDTISDFVYVNPLPSAQINQNPTICYGSATTLTSSVSPVNGTYQWSGFGLSGVNNQNQVTVSPQNGNSTQNASHIYELVYTLNGCTDTAFTTVNVNLIPSVLGLASEDTICPGQNIQLSATGTPTISNGNSGAYSWSTANPISSIGNSAIVSVSPITNTTYEVVYTMNGCNSPAYPVAITIQTAPQITIQNNPNATICEGGCVTLTAVPAASTITPSGYSWSTGETTQSIQVCPTDTAQYTVIGLSGTCQSPVATTTVNVTGDPVILSNLMADTSMCVGGSFTFNLATSGGVGTPSYTWYLNNQPNNYSGAALPNSNNASYSTPTIVQPTTQYYYAQVTYPGVGCNQLTSDVAQLNVVADPIVALDPVFNQTLCEGGTATCIAPVVTGGVGSNTYLWLPTMSADEIFCPPSDQIGTQNYNVIVQQSGIGCGSIPSNTIAITVVADPTIQIVGTANVCEGAEVPLITTVQGGLGTISSYQWSSSYPNGNPYININGANAFNYTTFILEDQVGIAVNMAQSVEGCNASDTFLINVFEDPQVSIIGDSLTCMGLVNNLQTLVTGGVPNSTNTFTWFSPGTEQNPTPYVVQSASQQSTYDGTISSDTSYFVSVDNSGFGCDNDTSAVFEVGVVQWAVANFDIDPEIPSQSILNPTFSFINTSENSTSYLWDLGECDPQLPYSELYTSPTLSYNPNSVDQLNYTYGCSPGYYSVTLYAFNQGMCPDTVTQIIRIRDEVIVYVPNAFTPGDLDNTNATFYPVIAGKIKPGTYRFSVFNRWGELIYETYDPTAQWDGRYSKTPIAQSGALSSDDFVQDGVYIWKLSFIAEETGDKVDRMGHVTKLQSDLGN